MLQTALTTDVFSEVIVLTAYGNVANAVECMKRGAFDYVEKNIPGVDVFELLVDEGRSRLWSGGRYRSRRCGRSSNIRRRVREVSTVLDEASRLLTDDGTRSLR